MSARGLLPEAEKQFAAALKEAERLAPPDLPVGHTSPTSNHFVFCVIIGPASLHATWAYMASVLTLTVRSLWKLKLCRQNLRHFTGFYLACLARITLARAFIFAASALRPVLRNRAT